MMSDRATQDYSVALLPAHPKSTSSLRSGREAEKIMPKFSTETAV